MAFHVFCRVCSTSRFLPFHTVWDKTGFMNTFCLQIGSQRTKAGPFLGKDGEALPKQKGTTFPSTRKCKASVFKFLRFEESFKKLRFRD